jgi:putative transposase
MPRKSKFTDEQIIRALREVDGGAKASDVCRRLGVTEQTLYRWRQRFGGMDVHEAKRLRALEDENAKLKKLLADQMLDNAALKDVLSKKWFIREFRGTHCGS